jgi:hypothetical protein
MTDRRVQIGATQDYLNMREVTSDAGQVLNEVVETNNYYSAIGVNSTQTPLASGATFQGTSEDVGDYARAAICFYTPFGEPTDISVTIEVSHDEINWSGPTRTVANTSVANPIMWAIAEKYFRIKIVNGTSTASVFSVQVQYSNNDDILLGHPLNETLINETGAIITRSVLVGKQDGGAYANVPVTAEGHLEVALHDPILPFGSVHTENLTPIFQTDAVLGINPAQSVVTTGRAIAGATSATVTGEDNLFKCNTGTTSYSFCSLQSLYRLRYRPGQGTVARFTALFPARADSSYLIAGVGTAESGFYFGYAHLAAAGLTSQEFGIFHVTGGKRSIRTLDVTAHTSTAGNVSVVLNSATGVDIAVLSGDSITDVANKIAAGTYDGWKAEAVGSTVVFLNNSAAVVSGTYTATGAGVTASFATTLEGVSSTDTFYAQSTWNGDVMDGTGASGVTLDPTKGNVFQIDITYLGFGPVTFKVRIGPTGNNPIWIPVHTINFENCQTTTSVSQPAFPFDMVAYSAGSTTDLSVQCASYAGFNEGQVALVGPRASISGTKTTVTASGFHALFSVRNARTMAHDDLTARANQSVAKLLSAGGAHDDATPIYYYLLKNATLAGTPNWTKWAEHSTLMVDTAATLATITDNSQIIEVIPIGQSGTILHDFEDVTTLQPGETLTLAATTTTGTSTFTIGVVNIREDQ